MKTFCFSPNAKKIDTKKCIDFIVGRLRERKLFIFFGAGVSRDFPTSNPLVADNGSIPGLRTLLKEILIQGCPPEAMDAIEKSIENRPLEWLLEHYVGILGGFALKFLSLLEKIENHPNPPNYNHYALALLAKERFCRFFLTVNFDTLFEQAFQMIKAEEGKALIIPEIENYVKERQIYERILTSTSHNNCYLFKLHGTLENQRSILTTVEALGFGLPRHKRKVIQNLLRGSTCLFVGYRAGDLDIFPVLDMLPLDAEIVWYEKDEKAKESELLGKFLTRRSHFLIISDLGPFLQEIFKRLKINDEPIWQHLPMNSFSELEKLQVSAEKEKGDMLRKFTEDFASENVSKEAACLIAARILSLNYPNGINLRERLIDSIDSKRLKPSLRYAYYAALAERAWNVGELSKAVEFRKLALYHIREAQLLPYEKTRVAIEQRLRIARDWFNLSKWSPGFLKRLCIWVCATKYYFISIIYLKLCRRQLTPNESGSLKLMCWYLPGNYFEGIHEKFLHKKLSFAVKKSEWVSLKKPLRVRLACKLASFLYKQHERYKEYSFGWNSHCMHRLGEMLFHQSQSDVPEAHRLFVEADVPILWVEDDPNKLQGELDQAVKPGLHIALRLLYAGDPEKALNLLRNQYENYEKTGHLSGKRKTLFYQALCFERLRDMEKLNNSLKQLEKLVDSYR